MVSCGHLLFSKNKLFNNNFSACINFVQIIFDASFIT